jgi:hypothetical protein
MVGNICEWKRQIYGDMNVYKQPEQRTNKQFPNGIDTSEAAYLLTYIF